MADEKSTTTPTAAELAAVLAYDPETGRFTWLRPPARARHVKAGAEAGCLASDGYRQIRISRRGYMAHRLAFLLMTGAWPAGQVDHINGDRADNRWSNLRDVSASVNTQNQRRAQRGNRAGLLGVSLEGGRYRARVRLNGTNQHMGLFDTPEEAHAAYLEAKRRLHAGCTV